MAKALKGGEGVREGKEAGEIGARGGGFASVGGSLALSNSLQALMRARMTDDYTSQVCAPATATTSAKSLDQSAGDQSEDIIYEICTYDIHMNM
jgi:7-keto-8-aminopelargonate synthetase-like enzyme